MVASIVHRPSTSSKDSFETSKSVLFKFHMQFLGKGGKKFYIFGPGHMTKMAAMFIYSKNLKNILLQNH